MKVFRWKTPRRLYGVGLILEPHVWACDETILRKAKPVMWATDCGVDDVHYWSDAVSWQFFLSFIIRNMSILSWGTKLTRRRGADARCHKRFSVCYVSFHLSSSQVHQNPHRHMQHQTDFCRVCAQQDDMSSNNQERPIDVESR